MLAPISTDVYDELITALYSGISSQDGFSGFLKRLKLILNAYTAILIVVDINPVKVHYTWAEGYPSGSLALLMKTGAINKDKAILEGVSAAAGGLYSLSKDRADYNPYAGLNPLTKALVKSLGLYDNAGISVAVENQNRRLLLTLNRNLSQGPFFFKELEVLTRLKPHLERAFFLHQLMASGHQKLTSLKASIEQLHYPLAILNLDKTVLSANSALRQLIDKHPNLGIDETTNQLWFADVEFAHTFENSCVTISGNYEKKKIEVTHLFLPTNDLPIRITLKPLRIDGKQTVSLILEFRDGNDQQDYRLRHIQNVLTCSEAEARVLKGLLVYGQASQVAEDLSLSLHTVRSHIKSVLQKNNYTRQIDLLTYLIKILD